MARLFSHVLFLATVPVSIVENAVVAALVGAAIGAGLSLVTALAGAQWKQQRRRLPFAVMGGCIGGIFGGVGIILSRLDGWGGLQASLSSDMFSFPVSSGFSTGGLISTLLVVGLTYVVGPDMYSRIFCAKDDRTARISTFTTAGLLIPIALAITVIGMGAAVLFPEISSEQALPTVIKEIFSPFLGGIVLAAGVTRWPDTQADKVDTVRVRFTVRVERLVPSGDTRATGEVR